MNQHENQVTPIAGRFGVEQRGEIFNVAEAIGKGLYFTHVSPNYGSFDDAKRAAQEWAAKEQA